MWDIKVSMEHLVSFLSCCGVGWGGILFVCFETGSQVLQATLKLAYVTKNARGFKVSARMERIGGSRCSESGQASGSVAAPVSVGHILTSVSPPLPSPASSFPLLLTHNQQ